MLAQFQARYPTGSLISELLQIHQEKFVVRVVAQVEGVTRATGLAAAETLEAAEDRARSRALMVLGIEPRPLSLLESPPFQAITSEVQSLTVPSPSTLTAQNDSTVTTTELFNDITYSSFSPASLEKESISVPGVSFGLKDKRLPLTSTPSVQAPDDFSLSNSSDQESIPGLNQTVYETAMEAKELIDLSDAIDRTSAELQRLGWNNQQGRDYLEKTYNKRSRKQLSDKEMLEFLEYLESQPTPNQLFG